MIKSVRPVSVGVSQGAIARQKCDVLVLGIFKDTRKVPQVYAALDKIAGGAIGEVCRLGDFQGKANETSLLYPHKSCPAQRIMVVGLGDKDKFQADTLRQAAGTALRQADKLNVDRVALALHQIADLDATLAGQVITEGAILGPYAYRDHLHKDEGDKKSNTGKLQVTLLDDRISTVRQLKNGAKVGVAIAQGQIRTRALANRPANEINPPSLAAEVARQAKQLGVRCKAFDDKKLKAMKMNALLAVGSGSVTKSRLIMLDYRGRRGHSDIDVVVVGKAITFDSGGLSLKPANSMETMKFDKSGGCAVLGIMAAVSELKLKLNVMGIIPSAENMPSQTSYRPGDILQTYSGKTIEVLNTDAEGRIILCDALAYAAELKPKVIVDIATLTGACVVALGENRAGLFSNQDALISAFEQAALRSGESVWHMPCGEEYLEPMRSKVADLKNAAGREGGSCTAAAFLKEFIGQTPWVHVDIAAVANNDKDKPYRSGGSTGFGVRLIVEYLLSL